MKISDGWRLIGNMGFFNIDWIDRSAEFGLLIGDTSIWNQGYGTEATELMLDHGFGTLNFHRIWLLVKATNPGAKRAYEKAGYVLEGTHRESVYQDGKYIDMYTMSILRPEWDARRTW